MEKKNRAIKLKIRKGDLVKVIAGDSKGSQGKIVEIIVDKNRAIVEGANMVSKHTKEAAIHISNLALVDPKTGATTRVGRKKNDAGKLVRVAKKSGEEIK
jgi:large subunit ribosomal protein L24